MKTAPLLLTGSLLLAGLIPVGSAPAGGPYRLTSSVVAAGGGSSQAGPYQLSGTLGQACAAPTDRLLDPAFQIEPGFWTTDFVLLQTPGAPRLRLVKTSSGQIQITWPASATGYTLEATTHLTRAPWQNVLARVLVQGDEQVVILNPTGPHRFFRLRKP